MAYIYRNVRKKIHTIKEEKMARIYVNVVVTLLFFISDAMPFIKSNNYNGLLDLIHKKFFHCEKGTVFPFLKNGKKDDSSTTTENHVK
jgi:hypothetical protein